MPAMGPLHPTDEWYLGSISLPGVEHKRQPKGPLILQENVPPVVSIYQHKTQTPAYRQMNPSQFLSARSKLDRHSVACLTLRSRRIQSVDRLHPTLGYYQVHSSADGAKPHSETTVNLTSLLGFPSLGLDRHSTVDITVKGRTFLMAMNKNILDQKKGTRSQIYQKDNTQRTPEIT